jgi:hypothetical protein
VSDNQTEAANRVARELAGAAVDAGSIAAEPQSVRTKRDVPYVRLPGDHYQLRAAADELGKILRQNGVFRREDMVVTIDREKGRIVPLTPQRFRSYVEEYCITAKYLGVDETGKTKWLTKTMTREVAQGVLESDAFCSQQRKLSRVAQAPMAVMRHSGPENGRIVLLHPGYDAESGVYTIDGPVKVEPDITLEAARRVLVELFKEFPFGDRKADGNSRGMAVTISAMLSLFGVGLLGPLTSRLHFVNTANTVGSGKSLLAKLAICPVFGPARVRVKGDNPEELKKELATAAIDGDAYFFIDDLEGTLRSQELNAFMTSSTVGGRMLGRLGGGFTAEKQCVVFITGNNLKLSTDIERRTLRVGLYTENFDVQEREITNPIDEAWLCRPSERGKILSALWALVREWDRAGRPKAGRVLRGFEEWCSVFGGIVIHAGFGDPCEPAPLDDNSGSNERADMLALVEALGEDMKGADGQPVRRKEFSFQELVEACQARDCFTWAMEGTWRRTKDSDEEWLELNQKSKSTLGRMWSEKFGGQVIKLKSGARVRFGHRGRNRGRRYIVEAV